MLPDVPLQGCLWTCIRKANRDAPCAYVRECAAPVKRERPQEEPMLCNEEHILKVVTHPDCPFEDTVMTSLSEYTIFCLLPCPVWQIPVAVAPGHVPSRAPFCIVAWATAILSSDHPLFALFVCLQAKANPKLAEAKKEKNDACRVRRAAAGSSKSFS